MKKEKMKKEKICGNCKHSCKDIYLKSEEYLHCQYDGVNTFYLRNHRCHYPQKFELKEE